MTHDIDLRLLWPAAATWVGAVWGVAGLSLVLLLVVIVAAARQQAPSRWLLLASVACGLAAALAAASAASAGGTLPLLEATRTVTVATLDLAVTDDPQRLGDSVVGARRVAGGVIVGVRVERVAVRDSVLRVRVPATVVSMDSSWAAALPGEHRRARCRVLDRPDGVLLRCDGESTVLRRAPAHQRLAGRLRHGMHDAVSRLPAAPRGLLPGLVLGDTSRLDRDVRDDFERVGMTHLVAVSGANVAIVVGAALLACRAIGVPLRPSAAVAGLVLAWFVVLARPSPSVLRAATMGAFALVALATGRPRAGTSALLGAVIALLLVDPALATRRGFVLSVAATAGLLLLAPRWREALGRRWPPWLADLVSVPLAAQVACAPVLVAMFGGVSLVAVPANVLAAPAVGVATVAGVLAAGLAPLSLPAAQAVAWVAAAPATWLVQIARVGAGVPWATVPWPAGWTGVLLLVSTAAVGVRLGRHAAVRRPFAAICVAVLLAGTGARAIAPSWPPPGWVLVACDVGQGDALVLRDGSAAVVVDTGPDPRSADHCLRDLGVRAVAAVVLTHFHADHVEGLPGVLRGRAVGEIVVGPLDEPVEEQARVVRWAAGRRVPIRRAMPGERARVGSLELSVLGPQRAVRGTSSDPNNSSLVITARVGGWRVLLTGDVEQEGQALALGTTPELRADVLKVAHHGSGSQLAEFTAAVGARVAITSVGLDNPYGHPSPETIRLVRRVGMRSYRTDVDGSVAVLRKHAGDGSVRVLARRGTGRPPTVPISFDRPASAAAWCGIPPPAPRPPPAETRHVSTQSAGDGPGMRSSMPWSRR